MTPAAVAQMQQLGAKFREVNDGSPGGLGIGRIVGHQQGWQAGGTRVLEDEASHPQAKVSIQPPEWFVQQQGPRLGDQGAHERDPGALTARQGRRIAPGESGQVGLGKRRLDPAPALLAAVPLARQGESEVLADREMGKQQIILKKDPDPAPLRWQPVERRAIQPEPTARLERGLEGATQHS